LVAWYCCEVSQAPSAYRKSRVSLAGVYVQVRAAFVVIFVDIVD